MLYILKFPCFYNAYYFYFLSLSSQYLVVYDPSLQLISRFLQLQLVSSVGPPHFKKMCIRDSGITGVVCNQLAHRIIGVVFNQLADGITGVVCNQLAHDITGVVCNQLAHGINGNGSVTVCVDRIPKIRFLTQSF